MVYLSRIYTKSGDHGETSLGDGSRIPKHHPRITAIGEVDELNAVLGLIHAHCPDIPDREVLRRVQNDLFDAGADLCFPLKDGEEPGACLRITAEQAAYLEQAIDRLNDRLKPLTSFVLPGGSPAAAWLHLARTVCRRAERALTALHAKEPINQQLMIYINRLSDYLFVLGRTANEQGGGDVLWVPGQNR